MRLGAVFPQAEFRQLGPDELVAFVERVEDAGYDHLLAFDHVLGADARARPGWSGFYDHHDPFLEPIVLFAYLARACGLELVTDVLVLPQRQTALVAKQVATLALLAPGRLRLGVGIGWNAVEYEALGIDFAARAGANSRSRSCCSGDSGPSRAWITPAGVGHRARRRDRAALHRLRCRSGSAPAPTRGGRPCGGGSPTAGSRCRTCNRAWSSRRRGTPCGLRRRTRRDPGRWDWKATSAPPDDVTQVVERAAQWRDAGANAIAINPLRGDARWPEGHLDVLLRAADLVR